MKTIKTTIVSMLICATSFAGVGFYMGTGLDSDGAGAVTNPAGFNFDVNDETTVGWDSEHGLMVGFAMPVDLTMRMSWSAGTGTIGVSRDWWGSEGGLGTT